MSDNKPTDNPFFDSWNRSQEHFYKMQSEWLSAAEKMTESADIENPFLSEPNQETWQQCNEQFSHWMKAYGNWFVPDELKSHNVDALAKKYLELLNPKYFFDNGAQQMGHIFKQMADGPEFSDLWILEKKMFKSSKEWLELQQLSDDFNDIISQAWRRAFKNYTDTMKDKKTDKDVDFQQLLDEWLQIANQELLTTFQEEKFLDLQRKIFRCCIEANLKRQEFAEMWCESHGIPTRTETDDLHKMVYTLRREVRSLKREISQLKQSTTVKKKRTASPAKKKTTPVKSALAAAKAEEKKPLQKPTIVSSNTDPKPSKPKATELKATETKLTEAKVTETKVAETKTAKASPKTGSVTKTEPEASSASETKVDSEPRTNGNAS